MVDVNKLVRENVKNLTPYSCARDEFNGIEGVFMDANENPYGNLNRYPDPYQKKLKAAISKIKGEAKETLFLGNGSDEIIDLCFRIFCNPGTDKALTFTPTYGMYEVSAAINDVDMIKVPLDENFQIDITKTEPWLSDIYLKLIFICSPNNPTGNCMRYTDIEYIISRFNGVVVIDEAYIDFTDSQSFIKLIGKYPNLVVMQTFSKAFGLASARVGMAWSDPVIVQYFNKIKPPYNISTQNQKAVLRKLEKVEEYKKQVTRLRSEKEKLISRLKKLNITEKIYPSDSNFLLVKVINADLIYNMLVKRSIIVRNRSSIIDNCLRITVGTPSENNKLISALKSISI
jgi:histidinol-phosphate aminotransferase